MENQRVNTRELREERFRKNPAAREKWERTALARAVARAVAIAVIRYRAEHGLSQRALAKRLGMPQPHIARLELGEHNPSVDMLPRLAQGLGQTFIVAVAPSERAEELVLPDGVQVLTDTRAADGSRVLAGSG
ncbi:MAG: helix-turn-helix transcriptional regulator [Dehalococcoidia bacterium]|nr:helix-turn-helix transcriptional regulator [Dehalococcoidia bacterium]